MSYLAKSPKTGKLYHDQFLQFSGLRRAVADQAFCAETTASFKFSREWQTPETLKLLILSLEKLV